MMLLPTLLLLLFAVINEAFVVINAPSIHAHSALFATGPDREQRTVSISPTIDDDQVKDLFAWISRAFQGDPDYNNLVIAIAAICGDLDESSLPRKMVSRAREYLRGQDETTPCGEPFSTYERESASLGAMGAGQWTGRWKTRPHALLDVSDMNDVDEDWVKSLPRGCRRTIQRALAQNYTVTRRPILGGRPAPHSSLAHFRCVVAHEVRVIAGTEGADVEDFFDALAEAVGRYLGTTRMTGDIYEYRDSETDKVIAIAHEVRKGRTSRGQWFYADDDAAKRYVWFHSVYECVRRAIATDGIDVVDLGPSGSDAFSDLKAKYGFRSVDDWPAVADYQGEFW